MKIAGLLGIEPGITAIIGGGGKTTLMFALAGELKSYGGVVVCTSTRIWAPENLPVRTGREEAVLAETLRRTPVVCVGTDCGDGKLTAPACSYERLAALASYVIVEADGAKGRPMKAHAPGEPVIPDGALQTILVMGASGFGMAIRSAAHRPALYAKMADAGEDDLITPELAARVALAERLHDRIFVNQVESDAAHSAAKELQTLLSCPVLAGSLRRREFNEVR